jgi:hypothetical protein
VAVGRNLQAELHNFFGIPARLGELQGGPYSSVLLVGSDSSYPADKATVSQLNRLALPLLRRKSDQLTGRKTLRLFIGLIILAVAMSALATHHQNPGRQVIP